MIHKSSMQLTAEVFYRFPSKEHTLKEVSMALKLAHTSVKKNLQELVKLGLILQRVEKKGRRKFPLYKANRNSKMYVQSKTIYNLTALMESGVIAHIEEKIMPKSIVVFGSYRRGEDTEESDVDLFVEGKKEELQLTAFKKKIGRKIELHFNEHFTSYPKELKNNIINGIVLHGFLEGY